MSTNQLDTKSTAWSALFSEPTDVMVNRYTSSISFDKRLWKADIAGSLAHAEMLCAQGILSAVCRGQHCVLNAPVDKSEQYHENKTGEE